MLPLFIKYQTRSGTCYVYDVESNEILRVGDAVYDIIQDYHVLTIDEMCRKHRALDEETIREAVTQLDMAQTRGLLRDHVPQISEKVASVCCEGKAETLPDFLRHRRRLLSIEVTHRCNLACEYCCFGKYYEQTRTPSTAPISLGTAIVAVTKFVANEPTGGAIGFYGGEPLLELDLIKEIIAFAEDLAEKRGVDIRFTMTTNGTLLSDETIHYLVAHKVSVMISLDGNRESHDRYRVFKNESHPGERRGSFDVIVKNMERFVQLYPRYINRGIVLTVTATTDVAASETFLRQWRESFPAFVSRPVSPVSSRLEAERRSYPLAIGQCHALACKDLSCGRRVRAEDVSHESPPFDNWPSATSPLRLQLDQLVSALCQTPDAVSATKLCQKAPIVYNIMSERTRSIHLRPILALAAGHPVVRMSCFPGAVRTYCSRDGVLFPCERTDFIDLLAIGNAENDVDVHKVCDVLVETIRLGCDCGNCVLNRFCVLCPSHIKESPEVPGSPDLLGLQKTCGQMTDEFCSGSRLRDYTEIMEANPKLLDWLYVKDGSQEDDWLADLRVLVAKRQGEDVPVEELVEWLD